EGGGPRPALRESAARVRGAGWPVALTLFGWYLLSAAGALVVLVGFGWLAGGLLRAAGERLGVVIPLTAGLLVLHALLTAGYSYAAPENTLSAFRKAIEAGADYAELDVQLTADGAVIVLHDRDFARVARVPKRPGQMTLAEVKELDAGRTFSPAYAGERVPT